MAYQYRRPTGKLTPLQREAYENTKWAKMFPYPRWTDQEQILIDWFTNYVSERTITKHVYQSLMFEVDKGPRGPLAVTHELQTKLNQAHYLVEGSYLDLYGLQFIQLPLASV